METFDNIFREQTAGLTKSSVSLEGGIRERGKANMANGDSQKDIEHLISSIPSIFIGLSKSNEVLYWNAKSERVFGTEAAAVIGLSLGQCTIDWDWDRVADGIAKSRSENLPTRVDDVLFRKQDGEERYLGLTINPLNGDNESPLGLVIIGADVTERKKMEAQLQQSQKMEAIGQLAAGIAHEINTPTQFVGDNTRFFQDAFVDLVEIIKIYQELIETAKSSSLADEQLQDAQEQIEELDLDYLLEEVPLAIQHTLKGVDRIAKIVQAMKIFAHPGMSEKELTPINKEIEKTITITRNEWKYVAEMETDFDSSLPPVPCFRAELNQVILNMIVNAAHAIAEVNKDNPSQKGTIRVRTCHDGDWAKIIISDTGAGIPEDIREKIFDLFFTTKAAGKGSGQGLAISHSVVVEKHSGTIDLESEVGNGTTFIIGLPLEVDQKRDD
jgi:PAS domain S-box-containing protein